VSAPRWLVNASIGTQNAVMVVLGVVAVVLVTAGSSVVLGFLAGFLCHGLALGYRFASWALR
jgi:hypothetical protein